MNEEVSQLLMKMLQGGAGGANPVATGVSNALGDVASGATNTLAEAGGGGLGKAMGFTKGGGFAGNVGGIGMAAGIGGEVLSALAPELSSNVRGADSTGFDFNADITAAGAAKKAKRDGIADTVADTLGGVPVIGGFVKGAKGVYDMASSILQPKASGDDLANEYNAVYQKEAGTAKQELYGSSFETDYLAAMGGYMEHYGDGGPTEVGVGGTHEQNEQNGVTISPGNKAEEGEVVVDLPKGQFVFTNRF